MANHQKKLYHVFDNSKAALKSELEGLRDDLEIEEDHLHLFDDKLYVYSCSPSFERDDILKRIDMVKAAIYQIKEDIKQYDKT